MLPETVTVDPPASLPASGPATEMLTCKLLDHVEKTFGDNYRKEIDQEENIWRSLPFFAASLALQMATMVGLASYLPEVSEALWWFVSGLLGCVAAFNLATIAFLTLSIAPAEFRYLAPEPDLRSYALSLAAAEAAQRTVAGDGTGASPSPDGLTVLKNELARQYGLATHHNRLINQRRGTRRTYAGLCMLVSVLATVILVGVIVQAHIGRALNVPAGVQANGAQNQQQQQYGELPDNPGEGHKQRRCEAQPRPGTGSGSAASDARRDEGVERHD
jgi:hypothetical protein